MRFKYYPVSQIIEDNVTGKRHYGNQAVADLLNELHEEKKQLKLFNNYLTELLNDLNGVSIEIEKVVE